MESRSSANSSTGSGWAEAVREEQKRELGGKGEQEEKTVWLENDSGRGQTTVGSVVIGCLLQTLTMPYMMRQHRIPQ